ncbi:MAG: CRISPR-associated helicase Cas3' [Bacillota bacterium]|nr:CRISPR-associated helicase Cas3' [Bacillota bacterium]
MNYWAHSLESADRARWQPLKDHLQAVADRARSFASEFGAEDAASIAGLCHDLGKYSLEFQSRLEDSRLHVDHSSAGAVVAAQRYGAVGRIIAYAVAGHHGGIPDGGDDVTEGTLLHRITRKDIPNFSAFAGEIELPAQPLRSRVSPQPNQAGFSAAFLVRMLFSCLVDADYLDTEQFLEPMKSSERGTSVSLSVLDSRLMECLRRKMVSAAPTHVNHKRAQVLEDCLTAAEHAPGLFTLTVPTGGGKTLSSLAFALKHALLHGLERVIYVIPFTSIIEQNAAVFREAVGEDAVLEHHSNVVSRNERLSHECTQRFDLAEENWDMPLVVTTNVQFFESLFSNKPSRCRKLHSIARSVVILDEAQMLPIELLDPCVAALNELVRNYRTSVVLCSATQPALGGRLPEGVQPREIAGDPSGLYTALRRVTVQNRGTITDRDVVAELLGHDQALCIVNTRRHARQLFELLGDRAGHYHLSAAMCPIHRTQRLHEIRARLKDGKPCRVVSTQLIEAGVDVDFPMVIRAIAGIDSIAQAAGRCNREGKLERGRVLVFTPACGEGMSHVWFRRTGAIGATILEQEADPLDLRSVERYFKDLYFYEGRRLDAHNIMQELELGAKSLSFPFRQIADRFRVIGDEMQGLVIPFDRDCGTLVAQVKAQGVSRGLARRLQPYTISVRPWDYGLLRDVGVLEEVEGVAVLRDMQLYDDSYGLSIARDKGKGDEVWIA